ncbi:MAG: hypothetical protein ABIK44_01735, partial [candidate division WOR-3 bacterium]
MKQENFNLLPSVSSSTGQHYYWDLLSRRFGLILAVFLTSTVLFLVITMHQPALFQSSATLFIGSDRALSDPRRL